MEIVFASHNQGKIKEIKELLSPFGVDVLSADDMHLPDVNETGLTFQENATLKAVAGAKESGLPTLADDSGLCVHALNNEPGIFSSRYAKKCGGYEQAFADLEKRLKDKDDKTAHFTCVLVLAYPNGKTYSFEGRVDGKIVKKKKGVNGFGFDPVFMPDGYTQTFATLGEKTKNKISHRARAMEAFTEELKKLLHFGE